MASVGRGHDGCRSPDPGSAGVYAPGRGCGIPGPEHPHADALHCEPEGLRGVVIHAELAEAGVRLGRKRGHAAGFNARLSRMLKVSVGWSGRTTAYSLGRPLEGAPSAEFLATCLIAATKVCTDGLRSERR